MVSVSIVLVLATGGNSCIWPVITSYHVQCTDSMAVCILAVCLLTVLFTKVVVLSDVVDRLHNRAVTWQEQSGQSCVPVMHIGWQIFDCSYGASRKTTKADNETVSVLMLANH